MPANPAGTAPTRHVYSPTQVDMELARKGFRHFATQAWHVVDPAPLVWTWASEAIAEHLTWITLGEIRFLMINIPPRQSKSTLCSVLWPAWEWIDYPQTQYLTGSYAIQLAQRDAMKSRNLMRHKWYQERWADRFRFSADENLKRQYSNDHGGRRVITATDAAVTGEGGNRVIVDDPHNVKEAESDVQRENVTSWWDDSMSSRLNQANIDSWMVIGQRTHEDDLFGHIQAKEDMSEIVHLTLPNEWDRSRKCITYSGYLDKKRASTETWKKYGTEGAMWKSRYRKKFEDPRTKPGELLNPERLDKKAIARLKRRMAGGNKYELQYQQDPKGGGGKILKREFWKRWEGEMPECSYIFSVWDTALSEKTSADFSAVTDWGLFTYADMLTNKNSGERFRGPERQCLMMLGAWKKQIPYYELEKVANDRYKQVEPDTVLIEKKVSGISLIQNFRRMRMRVTPVSIDHGGRAKIDINERAELAAPMLYDGLVYAPAGRQWAEDVIDECAKVPGGKNDDLAATVCMALMWLRRRHELKTWEDASDDGEVRLFKRKKRSIYG